MTEADNAYVRMRYRLAVEAVKRHRITAPEICWALRLDLATCDHILTKEDPQIEDAADVELALVWILGARAQKAQGTHIGGCP